jgi:hypothetical protein
VAVIRGNGRREGHGSSLGGEWNGRETSRGSCFVCYLLNPGKLESPHCLRIYLNSAVLIQQRREGDKGKKLDMLQDRHHQEPNATRYKLLPPVLPASYVQTIITYKYSITRLLRP